MLTKKQQNTSFLLDTIVIVISFFMVLHSLYQCWQTNNDTLTETKMAVNQEADLAVSDINNRLLYLMKTGQDFANAITDGKVAYSDIEKQAKKIMEDNHTKESPSKFYNFSVSFAKGVYDASKPEQLANWIYVVDKQTGQIKLLKRDYDYTIDDGSIHTQWYTQAVEQKKSFWQQPKFGDVSNNFLIAYSIPFFTSANKEKVAGVIAVGFSTDELKTIMYRQDYRKTGFSIILSEQGHLIFHPNHLMPLLDITHYNGYAQDTLEFINLLKKNNQSIQAYKIPKTNEKAWVLFKNIPASHWSYHIVFLEKELNIEQKNLASILYLIIASMIFIIAIAFMVFIRRNKKTTHLWYFSVIASFTFLIGISFLWKIADSQLMQLPANTQKIKSEKELNNYKKNQNDFLAALHKKPPIYVPTGIFIKSAEFQSANNITLSGYIWQKYQLDKALKPNTIPDDFCNFSADTIPIDKNILVFNAFEDDENSHLNCEQRSYEVINNHTITLGWYFKMQLRQPFNYSNFPLDKNLIALRLRPNTHSNDVLFTPDFTSYPYIYENFMMGVDKDFVLPSWQAFSTFYSTQTTNLNSNFGISNYIGQASQELLFNIAIKLVFLDSIFSTVLPIAIIYLILFVILFSKLEDLLAVLGINAGLLFSVALWHSSLRASLASTGITYFETFYFVCYLVISLVCINSLLMASGYQFAFLHYRNNLLPKLAFVPLVSSITFVITLSMLFF